MKYHVRVGTLRLLGYTFRIVSDWTTAVMARQQIGHATMGLHIFVRGSQICRSPGIWGLLRSPNLPVSARRGLFVSRHHFQSSLSKNDADSQNHSGNTPVNIFMEKVQTDRSVAQMCFLFSFSAFYGLLSNTAESPVFA